jgi:TadE-like protein
VTPGPIDRIRTRARRRHDRGSAALSAAILAGLLILLPMLLIQAAMYFHSRSVAASAARHGLEATRVAFGSETAGTVAAQDYLDQAGGPLVNTSVAASRSPTVASVTVSGDVSSVIPALAFPVTVTVSGPVERFEP